MVSKYRFQAIGGTLMVLLGVIFWAMTGTMERFHGHATDPTDSWVPIVRQIGILALTLPLLWAIFSIKMERSPCSRWDMKYSVVSGFATAYLMFQLLAKSITYGRLEPWFYFHPT